MHAPAFATTDNTQLSRALPALRRRNTILCILRHGSSVSCEETRSSIPTTAPERTLYSQFSGEGFLQLSRHSVETEDRRQARSIEPPYEAFAFLATKCACQHFTKGGCACAVTNGVVS
eukprot:scaffold1954_cov268-Pinguiococcus_pyrenoidosus.AAC.17